MIEDILKQDINSGIGSKIQVEIWDVLKRIQQEKGDEVFGNLSFIGMEDMLIKYGNGRYNEFIHNFYSTYGHYFVNCDYDTNLRNSKQRFNNQIKDRIIKK